MYHAHFGLERGLFGEGIATDAAVFRSAKHDRLIAHFKLALASASSTIVLRGPAGVGKTTLTATALRASNTRLALAWVNGLPANAAELLELVLIELGMSTLRTSRIERLQLWRQFLAETRATDSRLFVIAERTEDLSPDVLHALDQLTAPDAAGNPGANLVLLGHAGIDEHLAAPRLDSLRQRIRLRADLEPLTEAELQDYLRHQVACAGGDYDRLFAPGTVAALHRYSQGVARLVNTLCESALDIAAVQRHDQVTAELVAKTAVSLLGLAEPASAARPLAAAAPRSDSATRATDVRAAPPPAATPAPAVARPPEPQTPAASPAPVTIHPIAAPIAAAPVAPTPTPPAPPPAPPAAPPVAAVAAAPAFAPSKPSTAATAAPAPLPKTPPTPPPVPAPVTMATPTPFVEVEYDGGATDVADVALTDFPVLTDAVELPAPPVFVRPATAAPAPATMPAPLTAAAKPPAAKPVSRLETAYTTPRPAPQRPPAAAPPPATPPQPSAAPRVAAAKPASPASPAPAPVDPEADDVLRQTQTMRAIAVAKSIDDISELDAETLFSDAELDLVSAALASAEQWPDDVALGEPSAPTPPPTRAEAAPAKPAPPPIDDPFDLFGLGDDAPLELIDDSAPSPNDHTRKTAAR